VEAVAGAAPAVCRLDAPEDDEAGRTQGRDGPGGGVSGDPNAGGDIADTDGRDPAFLVVMGGQGHLLEGGPG
jgi:hypothetical protein